MIKRLFAVALITTTIAAPLYAQQDFSKVEVKAENLAPGVSVLFGGGAILACRMAKTAPF